LYLLRLLIILVQDLRTDLTFSWNFNVGSLVNLCNLFSMA
jgi:hypothetical protein